MGKMHTCLLISTILYANGALASAYKYENQDNQVEYSQTAPANVPATEIAPPPPPASSVQTELENVQQLEEGQAKQEMEAKRQKALEDANNEEARARAHNCEQFKQYLSNIESKARIKLIGPDGSAVILTQEQRDAEIAKAQEGIEANCTPYPEGQLTLPPPKPGT